MWSTVCSYPTEPLVFQGNHPIFSGKPDAMVKNKVTCVSWPQKCTKSGFALGVWTCYTSLFVVFLSKKTIGRKRTEIELFLQTNADFSGITCPNPKVNPHLETFWDQGTHLTLVVTIGSCFSEKTRWFSWKTSGSVG